MTTVVSFTDFRENLSKYIGFLAKGDVIEINDAKKNQKLITLVAEKESEFDWNEQLTWAKSLKPFLTSGDVKAMKKFRSDIDKRFASARKR